MANQTGSPWGQQQAFSRRQVLRYSGVAAAGVAGAGSLAACGGGGRRRFGQDPQKSGGILTHGATGGSSKDTLDAHRPVTNPDIARCFNLYEPLLIWDNDYRIAPGLAESVESSDGRAHVDDQAAPGRHLPQRQGRHGRGRALLPQARRRPEGADLGRRGTLAPIIDFDATKKADDAHGGDQAQDAVRAARQPAGRVHPRHRPGRLRPEEPGRHRSVQVQVVHARQEQCLHQVRRLLGRQGVRRRAAHPGLRRPERPGQRAAGRPGADASTTCPTT